jgi:nicotinate-nucleotide pyrophosphorylase (carboxylating)
MRAATGTGLELPPPEATWRTCLDAALAEDLGRAGDLTTLALIPAGARARGRIVARRNGVVAGLPLVAWILGRVGPAAELVCRTADGDLVAADTVLAEVHGPARQLLAAERVSLNLLGRLSGIATATRLLVDAVAGTRAAILDTRKTTPGLRSLEKYAVRCGGGSNHRFGLDDAVLIKDNHLALLAGGAGDAVRRARERVGRGVRVEIEVARLDPLEEAIAAGPDAVLLDNFALADLRRAVAVNRGRVPLEASGGITPETVRAVAETGVDRISVGWITHSAPALYVALDFEPAAAVLD